MNIPHILTHEFFEQDTHTVSKNLLGKVLHFHGKSGIIIETESYIGQDDPACHAARGRTKRTEVMFGPAGFSYVYLIYGMYYCLNFVTEQHDFPAAVLIRGVYVPGLLEKSRIISGPGRLCNFFGITKEHNNIRIIDNPKFYIQDIGLNFSCMSTPRIGITKGLDKLWRYVVDLAHLKDMDVPLSAEI